MNEFKINEFLSLKLEDGETNIYVTGELFDQCKFLMLDIPLDDAERFDEIDSIDEAADVLGWTANGQEGVEYSIDPETAFWGHCSNLQAWYEHDYDTRLLHSNLAFPLLKELTEAGDPAAIKVFKEEIVRRFQSSSSVTLYLLKEKYLQYLDTDELNLIIGNLLHISHKVLDNNKYHIYLEILEAIKDTGLIQENLILFLNGIEGLPKVHRYIVFPILINMIKETEMTNTQFSTIKTLCFNLLNDLDDLPLSRRYEAFSTLIDAMKETQLINTHDFIIKTKISDLTNSLDKLNSYTGDKLSDLISRIPGNEMFKELFPDLLHGLITLSKDKFTPEAHLTNEFYDFFRWVKQTNMFQERFSDLLATIDKFPEKKKYPYFRLLVDYIIENKLLNSYFSDLITLIEKLSEDNKYDAFSKIFDAIRGTELLNTKFSVLLEGFDNLPFSSKYGAFSMIVYNIKSSEIWTDYKSSMESIFIHLLNGIDKLPTIEQYSVFPEIVVPIKSTELLLKNRSIIETIFIDLINKLDKIPSPYSPSFAFSKLDLAIVGTEFEKTLYSHLLRGLKVLYNHGIQAVYKNFSHILYNSILELRFTDLLNVIVEIPKIYTDLRYKYEAFSELFYRIKGTKLMNERFLDLINELEKLPEAIKPCTYASLMRIIKESEMIMERIPEKTKEKIMMWKMKYKKTGKVRWTWGAFGRPL